MTPTPAPSLARAYAISQGVIRPSPLRNIRGGDPTPYTPNPAPTLRLDRAGRVEAARAIAAPRNDYGGR
jgi:hypothetical protein